MFFTLILSWIGKYKAFIVASVLTGLGKLAKDYITNRFLAKTQVEPISAEATIDTKPTRVKRAKSPKIEVVKLALYFILFVMCTGGYLYYAQISLEIVKSESSKLAILEEIKNYLMLLGVIIISRIVASAQTFDTILTSVIQTTKKFVKK